MCHLNQYFLTIDPIAFLFMIISDCRICKNHFLTYLFSNQQEEGVHFFRKNKFATAP